MLAVLVSIVLLQAAPAPLSLPEPAGPVGHDRIDVQTETPDTLTPAPDDTRRLAVDIWYPAAAEGPGPARPWASAAMGAALSEQFPFPDGFETGIRAHAIDEASPAEGSFPLIVFSHGLSFPVPLYQSFTENLAARGYVVAAISHPHAASFIEYADGTTLDTSAWPEFEDETGRQRFLSKHLSVWEADIDAVLGALEGLAAPGSGHRLAGHIDTNRIGVAGHSYGGSAAGRLSRDERVDAVVTLEGVVRDPEDAPEYRGTLEAGAPLLHVIGGYNRLALEVGDYEAGPDAPVYVAVINGTGHAQLSDLIFLYAHFADADWHARNRYGLAPGRVLQISHDYMTAFFDKHLKDEDTTPLLRPRGLAARLDRPSTAGYPEVDLTVDPG